MLPGLLTFLILQTEKKNQNNKKTPLLEILGEDLTALTPQPAGVQSSPLQTPL